MANGTRDKDDRSVERADEAALSARLRQLDDRLKHVRTSRPAEIQSGPRAPANASGLGRALRLSAELTGGVIVGAGLGLLIDRVIGSSPWGFIVMVLLGFAGGVLTVMRSAGVIPQQRIKN
ncbi:MAG: synthase protein [Variibacter sp.]|jgi:ATP synthase protein I|nr:synthase protein [Variibacter sp.]